MDITLLILRLLLAGVFCLAAVTKLADLTGSRAAMEGFGLPKRVAGPAGLALPLVELAIAILLLPLDTSWWGALAGLVLLLAFMGGIAYTLSQGRTPDCHCFGQVYSEPIGKPTLIRNGILAALAAVLVLRGPDGQGASLTGWLNDVSSANRVTLALGLLSLAAVTGLGWLLVQLMQQNGRLLVRIEALEESVASGAPLSRNSVPPAGLPIGTPAPAFSLAQLDGETVSLDDLQASEKPVLLVFTDPHCGPCGALLPEIGRWQEQHAHDLTLALVSRGTPDANAAKAAEHGISRVLLQHDREVSEAYRSVPTPSAVLVGPDGTIGAPAALGAEAIRVLVSRIVARQLPTAPSANGNGHHPPVARSRVGEPAPVVALPDLEGTEVSLEDFRGDPTLVLFWNPGCGFCNRMLDDLKALEADPPAGAPKLLMVSTGAVDANRAMGLRSTVMLDEGFSTGRAFGVSGTPSAVLVDAEGRIATEPVVGAPAVLALASQKMAAPTTGGPGTRS